MINPPSWVIAAILALAASAFYGAAYGEIRSAEIEYRRILPGARLLEVPTSREFDSLELKLNLNVIGPLYIDNRVHMLADSKQVQWVGMQNEAGLHLLMLDVFAGHHSEHALDSIHPWSRFPFQFSVGARWRLK